MIIRTAQDQDIAQLLLLYTFLHDNMMPVIDNKVEEIWTDIMQDVNHHIIVGVEDDMIIASCVLIIVPNLTHKQRPYALIENVITNPNYRNKGYATKLLDYAKDIANKHNCYKIMLMTGAKKETTLNFYKRAGYNTTDKTAFVQWLE